MPRGVLYAPLTAVRVILRLTGHQARREAAVRAERAARPRHPAERAPLLTACCERWWLTRGRAHERTCRIITEGIDQ
ncbi:hypothetical protein ADK44_00660 [Streptomyces rimosus subsp. rimosus]|nr:hypothetical protein ADK44_00660 [Streptomyces rimosus subsp. rimosus]QDA07221.1 hypothetical protein CTZ40_29205 [Streptomyces rimosus]